jgi:hypothetical protein
MERAEYKTAKGGSRDATPWNAGRAGAHLPSEALHPTRSSDVVPRIARERVPTLPHVAKTRRDAHRRITREFVPERVPTIASRDPTRVAPDRTWQARNLLNRQSLFKICVSIPSLTKSLSGTLEQFQHNNLVKNEKCQFVKAPHWQDRSGLALAIVCHRLRG